MSISLSFLAPTSSIDLNSNNDKLIKDYKVTPMIESSRIASNNANSLLDSQRLLGFWEVEARYKKYSWKGQ